jgi:hypothetical protein
MAKAVRCGEGAVSVLCFAAALVVNMSSSSIAQQVVEQRW